MQVLSFSALLFACEERAEEPRVEAPAPAISHAEEPPSAAPAPAPSPGGAHASHLTWTDPSGWERLPNKPMRLATYRVPGKQGKDAELAVFYFGPGGAGGIDANVQRWLGQFDGLDPSSVKREDRTANDLSQHVVEVPSGTFRGGMPMAPQAPQPNTGMLAAIVEAPEGAHFFKLTGPAETVSEARPAFFDLLDSVKAKRRPPAR